MPFITGLRPFTLSVRPRQCMMSHVDWILLRDNSVGGQERFVGLSVAKKIRGLLTEGNIDPTSIVPVVCLSRRSYASRGCHDGLQALNGSH